MLQSARVQMIEPMPDNTTDGSIVHWRALTHGWVRLDANVSQVH